MNLVGNIGETPPAQIDLSQKFTEGFDAYLIKDWDTAIDVFQHLVKAYPHDLAS